MNEKMKQLEAAAVVRVQNDVTAAKLALTQAEQAMPQEHAREMKRVVDLHHQAYTAKEVVYAEKFQCHREAWAQF